MALFKEKKKGFLSGLFSGMSRVDEEFLDELEEKLILADAGVETAEYAAEELRSARGLKGEEAIREKLVDVLTARMEEAGAEGVGVVIRAKHLCMMMRGVEKQNSEMTTSAVLGSFRSDEKVRQEFLSLI